MSRVEVKLNTAGVRELMKSLEMMAICQEHADATLRNLGSGYESNAYVGKNRVNIEVRAESFAARRENAANNTILKALR